MFVSILFLCLSRANQTPIHILNDTRLLVRFRSANRRRQLLLSDLIQNFDEVDVDWPQEEWSSTPLTAVVLSSPSAFLGEGNKAAAG